jgi:exodeoxyribonuclease V alpha subunit
MHGLMKALPDETALLIVGDVDQLLSVGPGQVLAELIAAGAVLVVRLTEIFRQAASSRIIVMAHRMNRGLMPDLGRAGASSEGGWRSVNVVFGCCPQRCPDSLSVDEYLLWVGASL